MASTTTRDALIEEHAALARYLAGRYLNRGQPLDVLSQVAMIGLVLAADRFDPSLGVQFQTYAARTILGELKRHFRDRGWAVRVPRRTQELYLQVRVAVDDLTQQLGRSPLVPEVAEHVGIEDEQVLEAMEAARAYRSGSIEAPTGDDETNTVSDTLGAPDAAFLGLERRDLASWLLDKLPDRERTIVEMRYVQDLTQAEIGHRLGLSQMHVSRLLGRSLERMRAWVTPTVAS